MSEERSLIDDTDWENEDVVGANALNEHAQEHIDLEGADSVDGEDITPSSVRQSDTLAHVEGVVIEQFESDSVAHYQGDTAWFDTVSSDFEGQDFMLEAVADDTSDQFLSIIANPPGYNTRRGMTYSAFMRVEDENDSRSQAGLAFLADADAGGITDGYEVRIETSSNNFRMLKWVDGSITNTSWSFPFEAGEWYRVEAVAKSDRIIGRVYDGDEVLLIEREYIDAQEDALALANGTGFGWHVRSNADSATTAAFDRLTHHPSQGRLINSPDINRLFVRDSDPALEYELHNDTDLWIDTSE